MPFMTAKHKWRTWMNAEQRMIALCASTLALYLANSWIQRVIFSTCISERAGISEPVRAAHRTAIVWEAALYGAVTVALFVAYVAVLNMARRGDLDRGKTRLLALAVPCMVNLALLACTPRFSQDLFGYMAHGFLGLMPNGNPLTQPAFQATDSIIGPQLAAYDWHGTVGITPYGIVWTRLEVAIMRISGDHLQTAMILFKTTVVVASLGTACLIWLLMGRICPSGQVLSTVAYLWNPVILVEFAGEGHNDAVMLFFVMVALTACGAQRSMLSWLAQWLAVLTKYISMLFLPAQLIYTWRMRRSAGLWFSDTVGALAVAVALAAFLYAPLWAGVHSIDGLISRGNIASSASPLGGISWILRHSPLAPMAGLLSVVLLTVPFLLGVVWLSIRVNSIVGLTRAFAWTSVGFMLLAAPDYWPWYACMPAALLIVAHSEVLLWFVILISLLARLCAPLELMRDHGFIGAILSRGATTGLGTTLPLAVLLIWFSQSRQRTGIMQDIAGR